MEYEQNQAPVENTEVEQEPSVEPSVEDLVEAIQNGGLSLEEFEELHNQGQISDETYVAVLDVLNPQEEQEADPYQEYVDGILNGSITENDLLSEVQNGNLTQDDYNNIMQQVQANQAVDGAMAPEPEVAPQPVEAKFQLVKLFDKFIDLKKILKIYLDAFNNIETDELTKFQLTRLAKLFKEITVLRDNIDFYMDNSFNNEEYNKNLYSYLLFNKDLVDQVRRFRLVLNLDPTEILKARLEQEQLLAKNKKKEEK